MADYTAGSVTAKIILDTSEFKKAMESLKKDVAALKGEFNSIKGINEFTKEIDELKKKVKSLSDVNKDYREQLKQLREENENLKKGFGNLNSEIDKGQKNIQNFLKQFSSASKTLNPFKKEVTEIEAALNKITKFDKINIPTTMGKQYSNNWELSLNQIEQASKALNGFSTGFGDYWATRQSNMRNAMEAYVAGIRNVERETKKYLTTVKTTETGMTGYINMINTLGARWEAAGHKLNDWGRGAKSASTLLNTLTNQWTKYAEIHGKAVNSSSQLNDYLIRMNGTFGQQQIRMSSLTSGWNQATESIVKGTEVLKGFNFALLEGIEYETRFYQKMVQLSSAMWKMNTQGIKDWAFNEEKGKWERTTKDLTSGLSGGYSQYVSQATQVMEKLRQETTKLKIATGELGQAYQKNGINLNTYKANMSGVTKEIDRLAQSAQRVKNAQLQLQYFQRTDWLNQYKANMGSINAELEKQQANLKKTETNARNAGRGITSFNNGIVQTAHSGRILSNTLYQIRGALLSLKMIATAMGGMALWGFAMEIAEGIKTTFTAKNEMEAQLKQNAKVGASGLREFNKELDVTAQKFQKINKYQLGETVSSLGVEFDLGMRQMKKAMPIVAMIQSEYVRAGRTSEEAALAVKDILQGEFQRLSRETGVGKDELTKYGWNGDKKDIDSLLDAVKKAGEDRHWDVFAQKATSLNDVIQITKNRFEEFGADFLQTISPMIVSGFNTVIGFIDKLHKAFEGMGSFGRNMAIGGGFIAGITAIGTALPMVTKGMGLAEVATMGWGKSLATATLNLNKTTVAQHGLRKAIAEVITGTNASELANVRSTKAIMGRLLGVKQSVLAEHGYATALVHSRGILLNHTGATNIAKISSMSLAQKIAYLTTNMKLQEVQGLKTSTAIRKIATSTRVLGLALKGLIAIGVVAWFASIAQWADTVRARVDLFNDYVDNGKQKVKDAKKTVSDYNKALSKMGSDDPNYAQTKANQKTAEQNLNSTIAANKLAKQIKKDSEETAKNYDMMYTRGLNSIYDENGYKAVEKYGEDYLQMKMAAYDIAHAEEEREKFQYASLQHIAEHTSLMKEAGVSEEKRLKYITEYSVKAKEAAENLKKFNEGDLTAGVYYVINRLQLMWIDLWNDTHFVKFWESVKKTWEDLQPTINQLVKSLGDLGHIMLDFFSTEQGQFVGGAIAIGAVIAGIGYKIAPTIKKLKDFGSTLADVLGKVKDWKKESGSDTSPTGDKDTTSTGGINGDIEGKGSGSLGTDVKNILGNRVRSFANNAALIAEGMLLMTEAIALLIAPMGALAATGFVFKSLEPQIRDGIEGLKLIAPVIAIFLPPVVALMAITKYFGDAFSTGMGTAFKASAQIIAVGMLLVAEAIVMLVAPMTAIAALGYVKGLLGNSVEQGKAAIEATSAALGALTPIIPLFIVAIGAGIIALSGVGALASVAIIVSGMTMVAIAIASLAIPMASIAALGGLFSDLSGVQAGAEAIKACATALKYVSEAFGHLVTVQWDMLKSSIASLLGIDMGDALNELVQDETGFLPQLSKFAEKFNGLEFTPINQDKATALANTATGITAVNDAMKAVKTAMENLPEEFKKGGNGNPSISYDPKTDSTAIVGSATDTEGYFDTLIEPLKQLKDFIDKFNNSPELDFGEGIDTSKVAAIQTASDMIIQIKSAVDNVKQTMGMIANAGWEQNMASGGIGAAISGWLVGLTPGGSTAEGYSSSLGSSLKEMENVVKDIITFNNNINTLVSGGNGDGNGTDSGGAVNAMTNMVTAVDQAIQSLTTTLQNAVPTVKSAAQGIGTGIRDGIQTGIGDLTNITVQPLTTALNTAKAYGHTYGQGVGYQTTQGYKTGLTIKSATETEIGNTLTYLDGKKQEFYDKGHALGEAVSNGYKDGEDMHSPGIIARSTFQELGYVATYFDDAMGYIPEKAYALAELMSSNFQPSLAMGGLSVEDLSAFESGLNTITYMANDTDMQTSMAFNNMNMTTSTTMGSMTTTVNGAFTNIDQNATTSYGRIVNTTRTSLKNMQDQTTKNIGAIRTSWHGMQTALIASAEQIRSETSSKIHQLESNMASFWNKIQNPANLLAAGNPMIGGHTRTQSRPTGISSHKGGRRLLAAGNPALGQRVTGISDKFRSIGSDSKIREKFAEYMQCLMNGGVCAAGGGSGWHFNWSKEIQDVFMQWHTHFGEIYDPYLRVGKFENDDFPVRGIAPIALKYIEDAISRTSYDFYYDERYSPLEAWNRGAFNCVDGANLAIAFANAFGFGGGELRYTTWDGIGHAYAYIPGLGVIDATAIQGHYGLTASKVSYSAGSHTVPQSRPPQTTQNSGITINIGDIIVRIEGDVENAEEKGKQIGDEINNRIYNMLRRSPSTGQ